MAVIIALFHGVAVFLLSYWLKSRAGWFGAVILTTLFALFTGSPKFFAADLVGIGIGAWLAWGNLKSKAN